VVRDEDLGGIGVPARAPGREEEVGAVGLEDGRGLPAQADLGKSFLLFCARKRARKKNVSFFFFLSRDPTGLSLSREAKEKK
jgi:hypothetical protein